MEKFKLICLIVTFLYIWFKTDAFLEYSKVFKLKFVKYQEFYEFRKKISSFEYHDFLLLHYPNFFVKLITCPICLSTWLSIISMFLLKYNFFDLGIIILGVWLVYFIVEKGIKILNE
jgi:hypothetical protein